MEEGHTAPEGRHRPALPHTVDTTRPPRVTATPGYKTDQPRGARPPRRATAAQTRQSTNHTGSRPLTTSPHTGGGVNTNTGDHRQDPTTHHSTLTARRLGRPHSTQGATIQTPRHGHWRERGRGGGTKDRGRHGGRETRWKGNWQSQGDHTTRPRGTRHSPRDRDPETARDQGAGPKGEQPMGHPPDPLDRMAQQDPSLYRPSECPHVRQRPRATNPPDNPSPRPRQQSHQSYQRRPHPTPVQGVRLTHCTAGLSKTRRSQTQRNTPQHIAAQHTTVQRNAAQHAATGHSTARHGAAQHGKAQPTTALQGTTRHDMAQHGTLEQDAAQHSAERRGAAQQSTAQHATAHQRPPQHQGKER